MLILKLNFPLLPLLGEPPHLPFVTSVFLPKTVFLDTCKPFLIFLRDNSEIILTEHDDIVNIFKRDLDVQMLISGYWFQKHATVVTWKNW